MATATRPEVRADGLKPGDQFLRLGYSSGPDITIEVLRDKEPAKDSFDRPGHFKFWCRRLDTNQEGYMPFGPDGMVNLPVG